MVAQSSVRIAFVGLVALASSVPALGCIPPAPPLPLPGETEDQYQSRSAAAHKANLDEEKRQFQGSLLEKADTVTLARVTSAEALMIESYPGRAIQASPVAVIKGDKLPSAIRLANRYMTTCGFAGGGSATAAKVGEYIVALHGRFFPSGELEWFGFTMDDLREPRLLKAINESAADLARYDGGAAR